MGALSNFSVNGYGKNGRFLSASEKEALQDWLIDDGMDDYFCSARNDEAAVVWFSDTSFHAYDNVCSSLESFTKIHPEIVVEVEYAGIDDDDYKRMRFKSGNIEVVDRVEYYPPFTKILIDENQ